MIIDTSAIVAAYDDGDPHHNDVKAALLVAHEPLILSPYVIAEADYLMTERHGVTTELTMLRDFIGGAWDLTDFDRHDLVAAIAVIDRYSDQRIGVTDASIVVLAKRYDTRTIATLDRRHFEVLRPLQGGRFEIVP